MGTTGEKQMSDIEITEHEPEKVILSANQLHPQGDMILCRQVPLPRASIVSPSGIVQDTAHEYQNLFRIYRCGPDVPEHFKPGGYAAVTTKFDHYNVGTVTFSFPRYDEKRHGKWMILPAELFCAVVALDDAVMADYLKDHTESHEKIFEAARNKG